MFPLTFQVISLSGSVKEVLQVPRVLLENTADLEKFALALPSVQKLLQGKKIKRVICKVVNPNKAVFNVVV